MLNKFAIQFADNALIDEGGLLQSDMMQISRNRPSVDTLDCDTVDNHLHSHSELNLLHQPYEEDEEVTQYEYWDDTWSKNGVSIVDKQKDILDSIEKNINSTNVTFTSDTLSFLKNWTFLFSRSLSNHRRRVIPRYNPTFITTSLQSSTSCT